MNGCSKLCVWGQTNDQILDRFALDIAPDGAGTAKTYRSRIGAALDRAEARKGAPIALVELLRDANELRSLLTDTAVYPGGWESSVHTKRSLRAAMTKFVAWAPPDTGCSPTTCRDSFREAVEGGSSVVEARLIAMHESAPIWLYNWGSHEGDRVAAVVTELANSASCFGLAVSRVYVQADAVWLMYLVEERQTVGALSATSGQSPNLFESGSLGQVVEEGARWPAIARRVLRLFRQTANGVAPR